MTRARKVDNFAEDATTPTTNWPDTTHLNYIVPPGKRWVLLGGIVFRSDSSTVVGSIVEASGEIIGRVMDEGAGTGYTMYPEAAFHTGNPHVLDVDNQIKFFFGTAQGATAFGSCVVLEIDV